MKSAFFLIASFLTANALANSWNETVTCHINKEAESGSEKFYKKESATLVVAGQHNLESGSATIESTLLPGYVITYDLITSGRYDLDTLTTTLKTDGSIVAKTSVFDGGDNPSFSNTFVTADGDFLVKIECRNTTEQNR